MCNTHIENTDIPNQIDSLKRDISNKEIPSNEYPKQSYGNNIHVLNESKNIDRIYENSDKKFINNIPKEDFLSSSDVIPNRETWKPNDE